MRQGVKRTQRDYSLTFKLALVGQIEKGELTYKQAQVRYGIQGRSTVLVWLRKHGRQDWSQGASVRAGRSITMPDPDNQTPEQHIKKLEQQLALMSQKAEFFEAVIDVLKNDYGRRCFPNRCSLKGTNWGLGDLITTILFKSASWARRFSPSPTGLNTTSL
ncbi:hypothetical protein PKDLPJHF_02599 [Aeromonas veronii]